MNWLDVIVKSDPVRGEKVCKFCTANSKKKVCDKFDQMIDLVLAIISELESGFDDPRVKP